MKTDCRNLFTTANLLAEITLALWISIKNTHFTQTRYRNVGCYVSSAFKCPARAHNMDNRFPPAEREAWIIVFTVNTGEAWNHTQRSMQELLFQLQPNYVHGGLSFPQPSTVCFHPKHVSAHLLTKLLIILICWVFVYWWSAPNPDWPHLTNFPFCNNCLHHDQVWRNF